MGNCAQQERAACPTQIPNPGLAECGHKPVHTTWLRNEGLLVGMGAKTYLDKNLVALILSFLLLPCAVLLSHPTALLDFSKWLLFCCAEPAPLTASCRSLRKSCSPACPVRTDGRREHSKEANETGEQRADKIPSGLKNIQLIF